MPYYRRARVPGGTYFFTVVTLNRQPILTNSDVRLALRVAIKEVQKTHPFKIEGWVLLPDHFHCVWMLPEQDDDYPQRLRLIKRHTTVMCGERYFNPGLLSDRRLRKHQGALWQNRYWEHVIRDERDKQNHLDYMHWNPVKHGLVNRVMDWPWSSFHRYCASGIYHQNWGGDDIAELDYE